MSLLDVIKYGEWINKAHLINTIRSELPERIIIGYTAWYFGSRISELDEFRGQGALWHYANIDLCKKKLTNLLLSYEDDHISCN